MGKKNSTISPPDLAEAQATLEEAVGKLRDLTERERVLAKELEKARQSVRDIQERYGPTWVDRPGVVGQVADLGREIEKAAANLGPCRDAIAEQKAIENAARELIGEHTRENAMPATDAAAVAWESWIQEGILRWDALYRAFEAEIRPAIESRLRQGSFTAHRGFQSRLMTNAVWRLEHGGKAEPVSSVGPWTPRRLGQFTTQEIIDHARGFYR